MARARIPFLVLAAGLVAGAAQATLLDTVGYGGKWYGLIDYATGAEAEAEAVSLGGHLATINNLHTHEFLWDYWKDDIGDGFGLWIGLNDVGSEGTHEWFDGQPVSFTYWAWGEPNNGFGDYEEDYVVMDGRWNPVGPWNDVPVEGPGYLPARGIVELPEFVQQQPSAPEPSTLALLGSAMAGLAALRRRSR